MAIGARAPQPHAGRWDNQMMTKKDIVAALRETVFRIGAVAACLAICVLAFVVTETRMGWISDVSSVDDHSIVPLLLCSVDSVMLLLLAVGIGLCIVAFHRHSTRKSPNTTPDGICQPADGSPKPSL